MTGGNSTLCDPPERSQLEPFATIYAEVIITEAISGGWFDSVQEVPDAELARITRRIETLNDRLFGHAIHPAVYVHALQVCGHFYYQAAASHTEAENHVSAADAAYSLTQNLLQYHRLYDLYLML